jgi:hypothetical protein
MCKNVRRTRADHDRARKNASLPGAWVLIAGILAIGKLIMITRNGNGNLLGDHAIHIVAAHHAG